MKVSTLSRLTRILSGHSKNRDALRRQPLGSASIMLSLIGIAVLLPIHLDRQSRLEAVEVQDIGADRMLAAKLEVT